MGIVMDRCAVKGCNEHATFLMVETYEDQEFRLPCCGDPLHKYYCTDYLQTLVSTVKAQVEYQNNDPSIH